MRTKVKSWVISSLKIAFAGVIIGWLIQSGRLDFNGLSSLAKPLPLLSTTLIMLIALFFNSERWRGILKSQSFFLSPTEAYRLTLIGSFFNFVIPGGVGGDVMKGYYIAKNNPNDRMRAVITIAMDRLLGLFAMTLMALAVMIWDYNTVSGQPKLQAIFVFLALLSLGFLVFWSLIFSRRLSSLPIIEKLILKLPYHHKILNLYKAFTSYNNLKSAFFQSLIWSLLSQGTAIFLIVYIGHQLGHSEVSIHTYFFVVPIGFMITAIPISPAGVGVGQAAFYFLFNLAHGKETNLGSTAITAYQILGFITGLIGAYFYVTYKKNVTSSDIQ